MNVTKVPRWRDVFGRFQKIVPELEVKLKLKAERLKREIVDIQQRKNTNNYVTISLLPTDDP